MNVLVVAGRAVSSNRSIHDLRANPRFSTVLSLHDREHRGSPSKRRRTTHAEATISDLRSNLNVSIMDHEEVYVGQRRSYAGALCTVRYYGQLSNTKGLWLGVEWDDTSRGKHEGQHEGQQIFTCLSPSSTAASFLRPSRKPDPARTLLEAIKFKYAPVANRDGNGPDGAIEISGKLVEEVGFERIQKQLSVLADLKIVLVDEMVVSGIAPRTTLEDDVHKAQLELGRICPNIVELDLGWNVVEMWQDVVDTCTALKKLKILKAGGLRLRNLTAKITDAHPLRRIEELHLNECKISPMQLLEVLFSGGQCSFQSLRTLSLSLNDLDSFAMFGEVEKLQCPSVTTIVLDNNKFRDLSSLSALFALFPGLTTLSLQGNAISSLGLDSPISFPTLETLNLAGNQIPDYSFIDRLPTLFPHLTSVRISRNPLYEQPRQQDESAEPSSAARRQQFAPSPTSDSTSYYLTLARIPKLKSLNYTTITSRDREEGEIYYLSVAEKELKSLLEAELAKHSSSRTSVEERVALARQKHPLYSTFCAKYDRENILQQQEQHSTEPFSTLPEKKSHLDRYAPGTLGSRLVDAYFFVPPTSSTPAPSSTTEPYHRPLPTTISVYHLKSLVARHFSLPALGFKLIYESHEYDPVAPINSTRNTGIGTGKPGDESAWAGWGDWDVDEDDTDPDKEREGSARDADGESEDGDDEVTPMYITREGHRFKKRETEILDGMRPWGDFLDVDAPGQKMRRDVRVRVEPHGKTGVKTR